MIEPLAALIGRNVHYWAAQAVAQHVRHDEVPFHARIVFVHPDGDVSVRGADHYGATFIDTHVKVKPVGPCMASLTRHGHGEQDGFCTWPVIVQRSAPMETVVSVVDPSADVAMASQAVDVVQSVGGVGAGGTEPVVPEQAKLDPEQRQQPSTDGERRAALEVANVQQSALDAMERRFQTPASSML